jgi:hypothetical protein
MPILVTASVVPSSPILVTLMMEALSSSETSVLTRATRRNIPEDAVLDLSLHNTKWALHHFHHEYSDTVIWVITKSERQLHIYRVSAF